MKKKNIGLTATTVLLLAVTIWLLSNNQLSKNETVETPVKIPETQSAEASNLKLSEIVAQSRQPLPAAASIEEGEVLTMDDQCRAADLQIVALTSAEIVEAILADELNMNLECLQALPPFAKGMISQVFELCQKPKVVEQPTMCESMMFIYKAHVMYQQSQEMALRDMSDEQLIQGFFATWDQPERLQEITNELALRRPNSPFVAKAAILPKALSAAKGASHAQIAKAIEPVLDRAIELNPEDPDVLSLDMFVAVENNEPGVQESLRQYSQQNPKSGLGHYYQARLAWKAQDRGRAIEFLNAALEREPDNANYKDALSKVKTNPFSEQSFVLQLNFNPANL